MNSGAQKQFVFPRRLRGVMVLAGLSGILTVIQASGAPLSPKAERATRAATFEVVSAKPQDGSVAYEKPLPLELLPFNIRSDAYLSIGTAFCIGRNRYVSAAHVFAAMVGSQYGPPALRDQSGRIYQIDQILKYSMQEDFVVFSLVQPPDVKPLPVSLKAAINTTVHAVGNALGEGVVIRDGLFTSETPEEQDGRWNWIRFSAAASPGASGGPLLDHRGQAIAVVVAVSPNENLNYALPIGRVTAASEGQARIEMRGPFGLPIARPSIIMTVNEQLPLPKQWAPFNEELLALLNRHIDATRAQLLQMHAERFFPRGENALELLHTLHFAAIPRLIMEGEDGRWTAQTLSNEATTLLSAEGKITAGTAAGAQILHLQKSKNVAVNALLTDSKAYMDMMLKALKLSRTIQSESVRITSLGPAQQESQHTDSYGRKWGLRTWSVPFNDAVLISLALPTPDGVVAFIRAAPSGRVHVNVEELKLLCDFIYLTYTGTLEEWREFLQLPSWRPEAFGKLDIAFEYDKFFRYKSPRFEFSTSFFLQDITAESRLSLKFSYFLDRGVVVWDVAGIALLEHVDGDVYVDILRRDAPAESQGEQFKKDWRKLIAREPPYDSRYYRYNDRTGISTAVVASANPPKPIDPSAKVVYQVSYVVDRDMSEAEMRSSQATVLEGLKILEE